MPKQNFDLTAFVAKGGEKKVVVQEKRKAGYLPPFLRRRQEILITVNHHFPKHLFPPEDCIPITYWVKGPLIVALPTLTIIQLNMADNEFATINYLWYLMETSPPGNVKYDLYLNGSIYQTKIPPLNASNRFSQENNDVYMGSGGDNAMCPRVWIFLKPKDELKIIATNTAGADKTCEAIVLGWRYTDQEMAKRLTK